MQPAGGNTLYDRLIAVKPAELSLNAWALKAGVSRTFFNDVRRRGNASHASLLKLLDAAGLSLADFDAGEVRVKSDVRASGIPSEQLRGAWMLADAKPVPLLGTAFGGDWEDQVELTELHLSDVLDHLARPPSLATDDEAYAVTTIGDSMAPRFEPGELVFVSPRAPLNPGDDVIVQLTDPNAQGDLEHRVTMVLLKRLVRRSSAFVELRQFNPDLTFRVPIARVRRIHRVKGRL